MNQQSITPSQILLMNRTIRYQAAIVRDDHLLQELGWFDLRRCETWDAMLDEENITFQLLQRVRAELGFMKND